MKFTVSSGELLSRLTVVGKAIAVKSSIPILDHFLFIISGNTLSIRGSDTEIVIDTTLEISNVEGEGRYVVPGDKLCEYLRKLPEQPISFNINQETNTIETTTNYGITKQTVYDATEYPAIHEIDPSNTTTIKLDSDILISGITKTVFATNTDEIRPALTGILVEFKNNSVTFVATDSHKLSRYTVSQISYNEESSFILSRKPAQMLKNILAKGELVNIEFNNKLVKFSTASYTFICRLIEAVYPQYNNIIPKDNPYTVTINRNELINTIARASVFTNGSYLVRLSCTSDSVKVAAQDTDLNCSAQESLPCTYDGNPLTIGFKANLLNELLTNLSSEEVKINVGDPSRAGLLSPATPTENEDELMLLMPMMIN